MFFEIAKDVNNLFGSVTRLPNGLVFNSDLGWKTHQVESFHILYKGYHTESFSKEELFKNMLNDPTPRYKGNFYLIISNSSKTIITHNIDRSSPLLKSLDQVTNLIMSDTKKIINVWADRYLTIDKEFNVKETFFSPYKKVFIKYNFTTALKIIDNLLCETFENFLTHNTKPIKVFLTGGIDTLTIYSYLDKFTKNYEIIDYEFKKFTHFYRHNWQSRLRKLWGYTQMHSWGEIPTVLMTGGNGDEFFLRGPTTANMMLLHYNIDIIKEIEAQRDCYHYDYFKREKNHKLFIEQQNNLELKKQLKNKDYTIDSILNILVNDHQHWHIDETIFFTPLKNLSIPQVLLGLPQEDFLQQVLDAKFQKELIKKNDPAKLKILSKYKNLDYLKFSNSL